jgi:GNAT superfamily N-acetyltransferase
MEDIPAAAALRRRAWPDALVTETGMRHFLSSAPARAEMALQAYEADGELVGWAIAARMWWQAEDIGMLGVSVEPSRQGEGIGTALVEAAAGHLRSLDVPTTRAESLDSPAARALAARRGFHERAASTVSAVDPRTVEPLSVPTDFELLPLAAIDDPVPVYELDLELARDMPNQEFDNVPFDEWLAQYWEDPMLDREASFLALVDGELVGVTYILVDRASGRAQNSLCGVRRHHRGQGYARLLKSHSLRRAAELGATIAFTGNDETNAPMLAVNTRLGYRPYMRRVEWERVRPTA